MSQFINSRDTLVTEAIDGFLRGQDGKVSRLDGFPHIKVVVRADWKSDQVAIISGGGSGHEPAHAGFVGKGMLTAAVCGEVFASPSVEAILAGILAVTGKKGCLLIVKNYTGDRLNFGLAAEKARAFGLNIKMVIVDDDISLPDDVQARGLAGTLFIHKIAGFLAEEGKNLDEIFDTAQSLIPLISSIGVSIDNCTVPGMPKDERITEGMAELGLGIHGEPGRELIAFENAGSIMQIILSHLQSKMNNDQKYALILNNLGGCTPLEMAVLKGEIAKSDLVSQLSLIIGPEMLMTSLDMHGFSVSILPSSKLVAEALTFPVGPRAWPNPVPLISPIISDMPKIQTKENWMPSENIELKHILQKCCLILKEKEQALNKLDSKIGDGDTGSTLASAARTLGEELDTLPLGDTKQFFEAMGELLSKAMGGSSGVLMAIFFSAAGQKFNNNLHWTKALEAGLNRMMEVGGAQIGDRTMIDALAPALKELNEGKTLLDVARAARAGADATRKMPIAKAGRAAYLSRGVLQNVTDPGAEAVACLFEGLAGDTSG
ncbi:MAG: dihydroxyacetone kinase [Rhodospirillaceae bacterium]|nr:dihydroxyacetone kinase [Rhodospirillaceae bacterium]|tara:strand:+ start:272 stop:1912 length:1641 start_codon:yes stop_codon:yes gene_type:complete